MTPNSRKKPCLFPQELKQAVKEDRIWLKSEKLPKDMLRDLYVDLGYIAQIDNNTNHLVSGRRGTGKTHLLRAFKNYIEEEKPNTDVAILCSILEISLIDSPFDDDCSGKRESYLAARNLFDQFLRNVFDELLASIQPKLSELDSDAANLTNNLLEELLREIELGSRFPGNSTVNIDQVLNTSNGSDQAEAPIIVPENATAVESSDDWEDSVETAGSVYRGRIDYQNIRNLFVRIIQCTNISTLHLLIDEWMELDKNTPSYIQNYFAQFLKKTFFNSAEISVVIASIWNQTSLYERTDMEMSSGLQIGHDIIHTVDLDTSLLESADAIEQYCAEILFRRLSRKIKNLADYRKDDDTIDDNFLIDIFDNNQNYKAYVAASHGIPRDLMKIFKFGAHAINGDFQHHCLDYQIIDNVARRIYRGDKRSTIKPGSPTKHMWSTINTYMADTGKRLFIVPEGVQKSSTAFRSLIDHELIHEIPSPTLPRWVRRGHRAYFIDYGNYVDWIRTRRTGLEQLIAEFVLPSWDGLSEADLSSLEIKVTPDVDKFASCDGCGEMTDMKHPVFVKLQICLGCGDKLQVSG